MILLKNGHFDDELNHIPDGLSSSLALILEIMFETWLCAC